MKFKTFIQKDNKEEIEIDINDIKSNINKFKDIMIIKIIKT